MEIRIIPTYPRYKACSDGRIIGIHGKALSPYQNDHGYLQVNIYPEGKKRDSISVHRLIASAFLGLDITDPTIHPHHLNEDKTDCSVENLELKTISEHNSITANHYFENDTLTHKRCRTCKQDKLREEYYPCKTSRDKLDFQCKVCCKKRYKSSKYAKRG